MQKKGLGKADKEKISKFFIDKNLCSLLLKNIEQLYLENLPYNYNFSIENYHLYIYVQSEALKEEQTSEQAKNGGQTLTYAIRITKSFPIQGVRLYCLANSYQPRISDSRDLLREAIGADWSWKLSLFDIIKGIQPLQQKLSQKSQQNLLMQNTGEFCLGDRFTMMQMKMFPALDIFKDIKNEEGVVLGTTETHFLVFKPIMGKEKVRFYSLARVCDLQCLHELHHNPQQNQIIVVLYKYRSIKAFNQYETISRKYRLQDSQRFIRNILKFITKFQRTSLEFQPGIGWENEEGFEATYKKMQECHELQKKIQGKKDIQMMETTYQKLGKNYQKIIEYFSARANCYYLIFVNKLNHLYSVEFK